MATAAVQPPVGAASKGKESMADAGELKKIRVTLSSKTVKPLEAVCAALVKGAHDQNLTVKGPVRMPTKVLKITTRKTPCGEGSKTWDRFEMRIHKRVVDIISPSHVVKQITSITVEPGVEVEVSLLSLPSSSRQA